MNTVKRLLTFIRGLWVKPAMTVLAMTVLILPFLLVFSTVFIVDKDLANGVVSGKYFWFYGSMGLVTLVGFFYRRGRKEARRVFVLDVLVLCFFASVCFSALLFNEASQNTTKLTLLTLLLVLYFSFRTVCHGGLDPQSPDKRKCQNLFCIFIIFTGLVEAIWGLRQLYGFTYSQHGLFKLTASFFNPGPYAGYLAVVFPLALYYTTPKSPEKTPKSPEGDLGECGFAFVVRGLRVKPAMTGAITCIAILLVLPAAMSRAAWLAAIAGSAMVIYSKYSAKILSLTKGKAPFRGLGVVGVFAVILFLSASLTGMYYLKKNSADGRLLMWKISLQTVLKHPFGVGLGNFSGAYGETQAEYFASGKGSEQEELLAGNPDYAFNEFLQILIESGIVSFLLFLVIVVQTFRSLIKKHAGMAGALVALLVFACFSYPFSILPFLIVLVFLISMARWNAEDTDNTDRRGFLYFTLSPSLRGRSPKQSGKLSFIALLCLLVTSFCLYKQYPVYQAYKEWNKNRVYYHSGLYKDIAETYRPLYPYLNDQIQFLFEYARSLSNAGQYEESNEALNRAVQISCDPMFYNIMGKNYQALKEYGKAEACLLKSTRIVPNRLYPWYLLTKLYDEMGLPDKVRETAEIVLTKEPKVQSQAVREMREEVEKLKVKN